jgi:hypothetical protein
VSSWPKSANIPNPDSPDIYNRQDEGLVELQRILRMSSEPSGATLCGKLPGASMLVMLFSVICPGPAALVVCFEQLRRDEDMSMLRPVASFL